MKELSWKLWEELAGKNHAEEGDSIAINDVGFVVSRCDARGVHLAEVTDLDDLDDDDDDDEE